MSVWSAPDQWMRGWCDQIYDSSSSSREETQREETNQDKTLIWARDSSSSSSSSCQWLDPDTHWSDQGIDPSRVFYFFIFLVQRVAVRVQHAASQHSRTRSHNVSPPQALNATGTVAFKAWGGDTLWELKSRVRRDSRTWVPRSYLKRGESLIHSSKSTVILGRSQVSVFD